ncbi:hypothetical protein KIM67_05600 [Flagellimonas sp. 389]|uniref:TapB family protein n=1 Tax=Flagellimonas sp. 389 TaxID=2835862 RepID=UPI001BD6D985|nr:hypothetical protein [Flagellimonas sp. 389]MBS9461877.1 hypothetical protein [Flagellimonas sp. 389]
MRIKTILSALAFCSCYFLIAQNNCSTFYPMEEGTSYQYTIYNKKDKIEGTTDYTVSKVSTSGDETYATMQLRFEDNKGKNVFESDYNITCTGDGVRIDYESLFPSQLQQQYKDMGMEMDITGTDVQIPNNLAVGQTLEDSNVNVSMDMGGMKMKINVEMTDRKVEAKESVTTSAGSFDCFLITEKGKSKVMMANQEMDNKIWLAEGVGMVKQESYGKNGKLLSRMELIKYSK